MHFVQKFRDFIRDPSLLKIKPLQKALNKDAIESMRSLGEADYILASLLTTITSIDTKYTIFYSKALVNSLKIY